MQSRQEKRHMKQGLSMVLASIALIFVVILWFSFRYTILWFD